MLAGMVNGVFVVQSSITPVHKRGRAIATIGRCVRSGHIHHDVGARNFRRFSLFFRIRNAEKPMMLCDCERASDSVLFPRGLRALEETNEWSKNGSTVFRPAQEN